MYPKRKTWEYKIWKFNIWCKYQGDRVNATNGPKDDLIPRKWYKRFTVIGCFEFILKKMKYS